MRTVTKAHGDNFIVHNFHLFTHKIKTWLLRHYKTNNKRYITKIEQANVKKASLKMASLVPTDSIL